MIPEIMWVKENQMCKVREAAAYKGFESIARNTILVYVLSNTYKVNLTTCTMNWKRNGYVELIYFQTPLFQHLFLRV